MADNETADGEQDTKPREKAAINLGVSPDVKWHYKTWCAAHRMKQVEAFKEAFQLLREKYGE